MPENTLKFAVGVMLTSFGMFWGAEGAGAHWPGGDAALLVIVPSTLLCSLGMVSALRRVGRPAREAQAAQAAKAAEAAEAAEARREAVRA